MRIGLNATCFDHRPSGANQRFLNIYGAVIRQNPDTEFFIYEPSDVPVSDWFAGAPNVVRRRTPVPSTGRLARARAGFGFWRRTLRADRLDIFEAFHLPLIRAPDCPTMFTIHDLRPLLPDRPWVQRLLAVRVLDHAFVHADRVVAVSDAIRDAILHLQPRAAVTTVYNGVDPRPFEQARQGPTEALAQLDLPARFMLAVGHLEKRKNLDLLIRSVGDLRDRGRLCPLLIVGNDAGELAQLQSLIASLQLQHIVRIIPGLDDAAVRSLYAAAHLIAFPSRYEGFGIPLLEAMAARRPIVASDIAVFREIMQDQGVFFDPDDALGAATAIERMWDDDVERERLVAFGLRRLPDFDFELLARQIAAIHRSLL